MKTALTIVLGSLWLASLNLANATELFKDDFQDGNYNGWSVSGTGTAYVTYYAGNYSMRLTNSKQASRSVSTAGFDNVSVELQFAASYLEWNDSCIGEVSPDNGSSWINVLTVTDGQDDGYTLYSGVKTDPLFNDNADLLIRVRAAGNQAYDYCWADNIVITGDEIVPPVQLYDPFSGSGNVIRSALGYSALNSSGYALKNYSAFAVPAQAANPNHTFSGKLELFNEATTGSFSEQGTNLAGSYTDPGHLPEFEFEFIQHGTHFIPVQRGLIPTSHPAWSYFLSPGRVWQENTDNGYSRVALPFALQENGANCTHNGVMTLLFKDDGSVSNVAYQIASETCAYFKFNMWGELSAQYSPYAITDTAQIQADYETEVASRLPVKPLSALASDYPQASLVMANIGSEQSANHQSTYGIAYQGVHYSAGCFSRYGDYPYCEVMTLPSYSTAKTVVGGIGLMRLEQKYTGNQKDLTVANWVGECTGAQWLDVTLENALDMATGNYTSSGYEVDEGSDAMLNGFFLTYTHNEKAGFSCGYSRQSAPGSLWVYHSTDTYLLGTAMQNYHAYLAGSGSDFFSDVLVDEIFKGLSLSPATYSSLRTFDARQQIYSGYGLTYHADDIIRLADFLNAGDGKIDGVQMLDAVMLSEALQHTSNRGLNAGSADSKYQHGIWAWNAKGTLGCANDSWVPYMSGYGGIGVVMLPGGLNYYFFSDNHEHQFVTTLTELAKLESVCQ